MADPEFTDTARSALLWVLWHHQGGSSPTGQAVRFALGMGQFDRMTADQVAQAKAWAPGIPGLAHTDPAGVPAAPAPDTVEALKAALPVLQDYASSNPMHFYRGAWQDPRGVHAAVRLVTAALGGALPDGAKR